jgi:uncharacterized membrane protein
MNATTESRSTSLPGGWILHAGPFAILAATAAYLRAHWSEIPERFPVHWGIDGRPNGWSMRTPMGVYGPLLIGAAVLASIGFLTYQTTRTRTARATDSDLAARLKREIAQRIGLFLAGVEFFLAGTFSLVGLLPLTGTPHIPLVLCAVAILIAAFAVLAWKMNAAQRRDQAILASALPLGAAEAHRSRAEHWKMGVFYCNPDDSALWVDKRSGLGYTLNFAHAEAWFMLAALLVLPLGMALFAILRR